MGPTLLASVIVAIGLVVFPGDAGDEEPATGPATGVLQSPLEQTCTRELARFVSAVDSWDGVANWAATRNGEPALDDLAAEAFLAMARIEGLEAGAAAALGRMDDALAGVNEMNDVPRVETRTAAVTAAGEAIVDLVAGHPNGAGCDLTRLAALLDG